MITKDDDATCGLTREEQLALPAAVDLEKAHRALSLIARRDTTSVEVAVSAQVAAWYGQGEGLAGTAAVAHHVDNAARRVVHGDGLSRGYAESFDAEGERRGGVLRHHGRRVGDRETPCTAGHALCTADSPHTAAQNRGGRKQGLTCPREFQGLPSRKQERPRQQ
ncbi:hypothetical protein [Streptomyces coeruleorubidus]|uniref:hypothetical protein n=1 Tax=Streptomyces coeruleorubidus TaxID=116188 RepID=UPI0033BB61DE